MTGLVLHPGPLMGGGSSLAFVDVAVAVEVDGTFTITAPAGRAVGDRLVVLYGEIDNAADPAPSGWTQRATEASGTRDAIVFSRTADGTSADNCALGAAGLTDATAMMAVLRSSASSTVYGDAVVVTGGNPMTGSDSVPSATATGPGDEILLVACSVPGGGTPSITTPSGFTQLGTATHTDSPRTSRGSVFHRAVTGAGAVGTTAVTTGTQDFGAGSKVLYA